MPDNALLRRFDIVVQSASEPLVHQYLEEAHRCFVGEAYNGAIVMAWNAVAYYLRQTVEAIGVPLFEHNYRILYTEGPPELLRVKDSSLIQTCQRMGMLRGVTDRLDNLRNRRNDCAHPTGFFASADETVEFVENIYDCVSRRVADEQLTEIAILREFIKTAGEQDCRSIARWVQDDICSQLAHDLLTMYLRDDTVENDSSIISLWHELWNKLNNVHKERLWSRLEQAVKDVLENKIKFRNPEDVVNFIIWPQSGEKNESRDRIGKLYIEWFESLINEESKFRGLDMDLARQLRQYLPEPLREQLQTIIIEMKRRF